MSLYGKTVLGTDGSYGYFDQNKSMYLSIANAIMVDWNSLPVGSIQDVVSAKIGPLFADSDYPIADIMAWIVGLCVQAFEPNQGNTLFYMNNTNIESVLATQQNKSACNSILYQEWDDSGNCPYFGNTCPWYCIPYTYNGSSNNFTFSNITPLQ